MSDDIGPAEEAVIFAQLGVIISRMADAGCFERRPSSAIPRDALTCGEAVVFIPLLFALLAQRNPSFSDPDELSELVNRAYLNSAGGKPH